MSQATVRSCVPSLLHIYAEAQLLMLHTLCTSIPRSCCDLSKCSGTGACEGNTAQPPTLYFFKTARVISTIQLSFNEDK